MSGFGKFIGSALGGTLIGTGVNAVLGMFGAKKERERSWDMWNAQNAYNTPAAQLQRFKDAGINPAYGAAMGSGNAGPVNAGASTTYTAEAPQALVMQLQYQQLKNAKLEGDRMAEVVKGVQLDNAYKAQTLESRVMIPDQQYNLLSGKASYEMQRGRWAQDAGYGYESTDTHNNPNVANYMRTMLLNKLGQSAYDLNVRNLYERQQLFPTKQELLRAQSGSAAQQLYDLKLGLTMQSDPLLRFLARGMQSGNGAFSSPLLPYQGGLSGASYLKDLLRILPPFLR